MTLAELFGCAAFEHAMMLWLLTDKKNENFFSGIFLKKINLHSKKMLFFKKRNFSGLLTSSLFLE